MAISTTSHHLSMRRALLALAAMVVVGFMVLGTTTLPAQAQNTASGTTITVNTSADEDNTDDKCSLREAITNANNDDQSGSEECAAGGGADTILFDLGESETITLGSALPTITDTEGLTIDGKSASINVSGNNEVQVFRVKGTLAGPAEFTLRNLTVTKGSATDTGVPSGTTGGGIFSQNATLNVTGSTFSENSAGAGGGGAIYSSGPLTVTDSTFSNNKATTYAGAIRGGNPLNVTGSTFSENSAGISGGALMTGSIAFTSTVTNSTFWKNSAENFLGGGIRNSGLLAVINSTFSQNSASEADVAGGYTGGGAIANYASGSSITPTSTTLRNTILDGNQGGNCQNAARSGGTFTDGGYNLSSDASCNLTDVTSKPDTDPRLDPRGLRDNGGPTETIALQREKSRAAIGEIPKGVNGCGTEIKTDQRGVKRPQGNEHKRCDIGAFERKPKR